jgi:hypothetical protein
MNFPGPFVVVCGRMGPGESFPGPFVAFCDEMGPKMPFPGPFAAEPLVAQAVAEGE